MAEYISFQPSDFFNTNLFEGTSSELVITGVGFQPDMNWTKDRDQAGYHVITDSARGATKTVFPDRTAIETTYAQGLKSFDSDGFTLGTDGTWNQSGDSMASWNWKAGTTTGIATNGSTTITPSAYSFNQTSGFSILKYTGNNTAGAKLAHGLDAAPHAIFVKNLDAVNDWYVYHRTLDATASEDYYLVLNTTGAKVDSNGAWYDTAPDSVNITLGSNASVNNTDDFIAYCFTEKFGYSKFASYTGTGANGSSGSSSGVYVYTGFSPKFLVIKALDSEGWVMKTPVTDTPPYNASTRFLVADTDAASSTGALIDFTAQGFKMRNTLSSLNTNGQKYVYMAWAEFPIVSSNDMPNVAR